jgi:O-antigen/teichoic acid export membrane protein
MRVIDGMSDERVSRSASFAFVSQMVSAAFTAGLTIFLGRRLTPDQFGEFTFALSVILLATLFSDLGITSSTGRFLAERRDDPDAAAAVLRTALRLKWLVSVAASLLLILLSGPICDAFGQHGAIWPLRGVALALLGQSMLMLPLGAFIALGKVRYNVVLSTAESVVETTASVVLVLLGAGATGAAFGRAIGYAVGIAVGIFVMGRTIGALRRAGAGAAPTLHAPVPPRRILSYAGPLVVIDAAFRVFSSIDVLLIAALLGGSAQVAAFGLPMRLAAFLDYPAAAIGSAVAPRLARRGQDDVALLGQSMRYLTIVQVVITVPCLVWPEAILHLLFSNRYPEAPGVLRALTPFLLLAGLAQPVTLAVNYLGEARKRVPIAVAMLTVNVVVDVILLPKIGVVAAAVGTSAAYAVWVPAHLWVLRRDLGLPLRPLAITTLRCLLAGGAMAAVLALIGTGIVSLPLMLLGAVAGPLAYLLALLALRELDAGDAAIVRRVLARRVAA